MVGVLGDIETPGDIQRHPGDAGAEPEVAVCSERTE